MAGREEILIDRPPGRAKDREKGKTMVMTKIEFKKRWDSDENGGGITFDDIADCAKAWGLFATPRIHEIGKVVAAVVKAAKTKDWSDY